MGDPAMQLGDAELRRIGGYVKENLREWLREVAPVALSPPAPVSPAPDPVTNTQLLERVVRVEEELKAQRELFLVRFEAVDRRFEASDQRFIDMNTRFEDMNTRFEDMNTRLEDMRDYLNRRFNALTWMIGLLITVVVAALGIMVT